MSPFGEATLADFGIARIAGQGTVTATGSVMGPRSTWRPSWSGVQSPRSNPTSTRGVHPLRAGRGQAGLLEGRGRQRVGRHGPPHNRGTPAAQRRSSRAQRRHPDRDGQGARGADRDGSRPGPAAPSRCRRPRASRPSPCPSQPARRSPMHGEPPRWTAGSSAPSRLRPRMRPAPPATPTPVPAASTPPVATLCRAGHTDRGAHSRWSARHEPRRRRPIVHTGPRSRWSASRILRPPAEAAPPRTAPGAGTRRHRGGGAARRGRARLRSAEWGRGRRGSVTRSGPPRSGTGRRSYRRRTTEAMRVAVPAADPTTVALEERPRRPACTSSSWRRTSRARCS